MGNCMDPPSLTQLNKKEIKLKFDKEETAMGPEYRQKTTDDQTLKVLTAEKARAPQQSRTYEKGTVRVSVF
ncbi:unnamed protein product [Blepharisma stoltei]|uniref:Uncharacterized protein n=1 Tax=Blepharisma stoltei TaxID=1481888 RepID=A0AAU9J166_9CILI|nr:unnamed protein product [Blepharisma stoltei]